MSNATGLGVSRWFWSHSRLPAVFQAQKPRCIPFKGASLTKALETRSEFPSSSSMTRSEGFRPAGGIGAGVDMFSW